MRKYWLKRMRGYKYLLDKKNLVIHDLDRVHSLCNKDDIPKKYRKFLTQDQCDNAFGLIKKCKYCNFPSLD